MKKLNALEADILKRLSVKCPVNLLHMPYIEVKDRVKTGVGMYVNFEYTNPKIVETNPIESAPYGVIGNSELIQLKGLNLGLVFEVNLKEGKLHFIELVTIGEAWDGVIDEEYRFEQH